MFKVHLSLLLGCRSGLLLEFMQDNLAFFITEKKNILLLSALFGRLSVINFQIRGVFGLLLDSFN